MINQQDIGQLNKRNIKIKPTPLPLLGMFSGLNDFPSKATLPNPDLKASGQI